MKKLIIMLIIVTLLIIGYAHDQFLWCKKLFLTEPTTHTIQKGEYLSRIAKQYYGSADYWRELALVNRAPNSDVIFPGEEIVIPSIDVIKEIRKTRWLSKVNRYMGNQEDILAGRINSQNDHRLADTIPAAESEAEPLSVETEPESEVIGSGAEQVTVETESVRESKAPVKSSSLYLILAIVGVAFVGALIAFILYRRKKQDDIYSIVDDINLDTKADDEESEPDYQQYLRKNKESEEVMVS